MQPPDHIRKHLSNDPILKPLIDNCVLRDRPGQPTVYEALLRSINFQQLSGASATAIHTRFLNLFPGQYPDPNKIIHMAPDELRGAGLSRQKATYVLNTAKFFLENNLMNKNWNPISDHDIIKELTRIKGVGRWTVEMILMFTLKRPDVLPLNDLVVRNNIIDLYDVKDLKGKALTQRLHEIAEPWRPYRTTASRYLWQGKDTPV
ncbi:DNA-3-methyladenine glycosylase 2 family protein [Membranicola marinus]|uniref:DNA-3-methyladenine glycosylase II n=1 Tax=Membranihabitans marinus TaxID=1227546 RepID=A0A953HQ22_9BACT|nr:DNA-3-methyladenine glycosylase 2 family protein [Membranihabitans marinus]MBY5960099.1 DNA-3-methyladenine glycosylase 2 family protein [Membranihabitans marinus]